MSVPGNEYQRLADLYSYGILDTSAEKIFDDVVEMAANLCQMPHAMLNLVDADRLWTKAGYGIHGLDIQTRRDKSPCAQAVLCDGIFEVVDGHAEGRLTARVVADSSLTIRSYAGASLITPNGQRIGTLCVFGSEPVPLNESQRSGLQKLADMAISLLEAKREARLRQEYESLLNDVNQANKNIMEYSLDVICTLDREGVFVQVSAASFRMWGYRPDELEGASSFNIVHPDDRKQTRDVSALIVHGLEVPDFENRYVHKDGSVVDLIWSFKWSESEQLIFAIARDITERKIAEERIRQAQHKTTEILESISDAFFAVDNQWCLTYVNEMANRLFPNARGNLIGKRFWDEFSNASGDELKRQFHRAKANLEPIQFELFDQKLGAWFGVAVYPHADGLSVYYRDISDTKRIEEARRESEAYFRATFERAPEGIAHVALEGQWLRLNQKFCDIVGYAEAELLELRYQDITHPDDHEADCRKIRALLELDDDSPIEKRYIHKSGSIVWVELAASVVRGADGSPKYFIAVVSDITERKRIQEELRMVREDFQLLVDGTADYAIILLDQHGRIQRWNTGAERIFGYSGAEVIGQSAAIFYTPEDKQNGRLEQELEQTVTIGRAEDDRWHLRRDGSRFWANGVVSPLYDEQGRLRGFAKILRDNTERRMSEEKTRYLANHDALTGLANRANFSNRLHEQIALSRRNQHLLAVHLLDMDRFKTINDTLGHHVGDLLLKEVANRLSACVRETDVVARIGGDEFVVIQTQLSRADAAGVLAQKIVEQLASPYQLDGLEVHSGASIGVTIFPPDGEDPVQLLKNADMAMYKAKAMGRYNYQFYTEDLHTEAQLRQSLEYDLRGALQNGEFELYYQPQIDLKTWQITGVEALLRWQRPQLQLLTPPEFLRFAEELGLSVQIGEWVLLTACRQNKAWQAAGLPPFRVAVNFSARQFSDSHFIHMVESILAETGLPAACLELEITEDMLMKNSKTSLDSLARLKALGVHVSIDDFGTGYSSLSYLKHFPVTSLKIDRTFIQHIPHNREDIAIVSAVINLARSLNIQVIAEGVETSEQLAFLETQACNSAQGFLFSHPVPAGELVGIFNRGCWSRLNARA